MNIKTSGVFLSSFLFPLFIGLIVFGAIIHESGHAIACGLFGCPYSISVSQVVYDSSSLNASANMLIRFSGGFFGAICCIISLFLASKGDKKGSYYSLALLGSELAFLSLAIFEVFTAIWEGAFYENYLVYYNNGFTTLILLIVSMAFSAFFFKKWKGQFLNRITVPIEN
jgi:hypothetical protein